MADGTIVNKFVGDKSDLERAITTLQSKYEKLTSDIVAGTNKAKTAAKQAAEAQKAWDKEVSLGMKEAKGELRNFVTSAKKAEAEQRAEKRSTTKAWKEEVRLGTREAKGELRNHLNAVKRAEAEERSEKSKTTKAWNEEVRLGMKEAKGELRSYLNSVKKAEAEQQAEKRKTTKVWKEEVRLGVKQAKGELRNYVAGVKSAEREALKISRAQQKATDQVTDWAVGIGVGAASYVSVVGTLKKIIELQEESIRKADEFGDKQDRRTRSFTVNAGITLKEGELADKSIREVAARTGVPMEQVEEAASGLVGSDFSWQHASGAAVENLIKAKNVTGGGDAGELANNMALVLNAQGMEKTPENIERIGRTVYGSRRAGRIESKSLEFFARQMSIAKDRSLEENIAFANLLMDVTTDEPAANAFGGFHKTLRAPKPSDLKAMKRFKVDPKRVDFIGEGEDTGSILKYLRDTRNRLPETERASFEQAIFGEHYGSTIKQAIDTADVYNTKLNAAKDFKGYEEAVATAHGGSAAMHAKNQIAVENQFAAQKTDVTDIMDIIEEQQRAGGAHELGIWLNRFGGNRSRNFSDDGEIPISMMAGDEDVRMQALMTARERKGAPLTGIPQAWIDAVEQNTAEMKRNNDLIDQQNKQNGRPNPQANPEAKRPKPVNAGE